MSGAQRSLVFGGKGIIDLAIAAKRSDWDKISKILGNLAYLFRESGSTAERWFFRADLPDEKESVRRYHIHLTTYGSAEGLI